MRTHTQTHMLTDREPLLQHRNTALSQLGTTQCVFLCVFLCVCFCVCVSSEVRSLLGMVRHGMGSFLVFVGLDGSKEELGIVSTNFWMYKHNDLDAMSVTLSPCCPPYSDLLSPPPSLLLFLPDLPLPPSVSPSFIILCLSFLFHPPIMLQLFLPVSLQSFPLLSPHCRPFFCPLFLPPVEDSNP